jgi:AraC family transcriptional regulator of adaptative response/methylated-DNA-[protein]-cysteine methyltransferase
MMLMTFKTPDIVLSGDDERWQAVLQRDGRRDGEFVFAVSSTGIYCRPSCPARRPRREHVRFFRDPVTAERAGYRACRRCRPRAAMTNREELVARATDWLDGHVEERVTLSHLASVLGVSAGHLQRTFTKIVGVSPRAYAAARRLERAKAHLRGGDDVTRAIHAAGYGSSSRFYEQARDALGMSPSTYRRGGEGMTIGYTLADSLVGRVLVAATERGLCMVSIGDDEAALTETLTAEYPRAVIRRDDEALFSSLAVVLGHLAQRTPLTALPLDVTGTPFQRTVWQALRVIPEGEQRTYGEVAASLGRARRGRWPTRAPPIRWRS